MDKDVLAEYIRTKREQGVPPLPVPIPFRPCDTCGRLYQNSCSACSRRTSVTRLCVCCGNAFRVEKAEAIKSGRGRFCSRACKQEAQRGVERKRVGSISYTRTDGYVVVKSGINQEQLQHRYVMEQALSRKLGSNEQVHHINGVKSDNRLENLRLMTNSDHQKLHEHLVRPSTRVTLDCRCCGKPYTTKASRAETSHFCSNACKLIVIHEGNRKRRGKQPIEE